MESSSGRGNASTGENGGIPVIQLELLFFWGLREEDMALKEMERKRWRENTISMLITSRRWANISFSKLTRSRFPGSQPVSFDLHSLQLLETEEWVTQSRVSGFYLAFWLSVVESFWVCEKSDGVRVLVLIVATGFGQETYLVCTYLPISTRILDWLAHLEFCADRSKREHLPKLLSHFPSSRRSRVQSFEHSPWCRIRHRCGSGHWSGESY